MRRAHSPRRMRLARHQRSWAPRTDVTPRTSQPTLHHASFKRGGGNPHHTSISPECSWLIFCLWEGPFSLDWPSAFLSKPPQGSFWISSCHVPRTPLVLGPVLPSFFGDTSSLFTSSPLTKPKGSKHPAFAPSSRFPADHSLAGVWFPPLRDGMRNILDSATSQGGSVQQSARLRERLFTV